MDKYIKTKPIDWFTERSLHDRHYRFAVYIEKISVANAFFASEIEKLNRLFDLNDIFDTGGFLYSSMSHGVIPKICVCNYDD